MPRSGKCLYKVNEAGGVSLRVAAAVGTDNVPTLTPFQSTDDNKPSKQKVAAIVGGVGASVLVIIIVILVYICLMRIKKHLSQTSDTSSSVTSPPESARGNISPYATAQSPFGTQNLRQLSIAELEHATKNFSQSNIIGEGTFGLVYKGLLLDGSIVAIKRRLHKPFPDFIHKVKPIASVHHRHLVELIGYCEDIHQQLLVYDYIANGNIGSYLYDSEGLPIGKLDMKQRLTIASAAAKGLEYLHSRDPPLLHMHFRTSNVLLGDKFPKVSDYGVLNLVTEGHRASSSSAVDSFLDPELSSSKNHSEGSDVYSFGVFLLELISGREANGKYQSNSGKTIVEEARECNVRNFVDKSVEEHNLKGARKIMELALQCIDVSRKRPSMRRVVEEIEQIQGSEMGYLQADFGEEIGSVALGSELFK
ncbi:leucine-rich repeat receptor protein kinase HPCA1-like isoform X2 [Euphorbia lathyris]|uniref:leucine-rich repeat receptor protein kinase HPCA1-like isoform X2 n=1 Tax=Euphorbia lathyris TaxID=212925 RepID=UPI0033131D4C